jgi:hypothetical protein
MAFPFRDLRALIYRPGALEFRTLTVQSIRMTLPVRSAGRPWCVSLFMRFFCWCLLPVVLSSGSLAFGADCVAEAQHYIRKTQCVSGPYFMSRKEAQA